MKKQKQIDVAAQSEAAVETVQTEVVTAEVTVKKAPGRPVVAGSARQLKLAEQAEKRAKGELKRGRPVVSNSARQQKLAERAAKLAAGLEIKPGRPKVEKPTEPAVAEPAVAEQTA